MFGHSVKSHIVFFFVECRTKLRQHVKLNTPILKMCLETPVFFSSLVHSFYLFLYTTTHVNVLDRGQLAPTPVYFYKLTSSDRLVYYSFRQPSTSLARWPGCNITPWIVTNVFWKSVLYSGHYVVWTEYLMHIFFSLSVFVSLSFFPLHIFHIICLSSTLLWPSCLSVHLSFCSRHIVCGWGCERVSVSGWRWKACPLAVATTTHSPTATRPTTLWPSATNDGLMSSTQPTQLTRASTGASLIWLAAHFHADITAHSTSLRVNVPLCPMWDRGA